MTTNGNTTPSANQHEGQELGTLASESPSLLEVIERHLNMKEKLGHYDALLGVINLPSGHTRMRGGYKLWPERTFNPANGLRIMSIGSSTSLWPEANWSERVAQALDAKGHKLTLYHGAGKGSASTQDVFRVLRDAPAIDPHLIMSVSGGADVGYLLLAKNNPYCHKYTRRAMDFLVDTGMITELTYGMPMAASPAENYCRNQRTMRVLADELGAKILTFLVPVQGYGSYPMTEEERINYETKAGVILKAIDKPYGECVTEFFDEVRSIIAASPEKYSHIVDFSDVMADCPGGYRDHRHHSELGIAHLSERMLPHVMQSLGL